jgi:hypothetical protein
MAEGMDEMATLVGKAMASEDLSAFTELLDPDVTWGAPNPIFAVTGSRAL